MAASRRESVKLFTQTFPCSALLFAACLPTIAFAADRVKIANGIIESTAAPNDGVRTFKGIPFAQPPVGNLRWREPQPVQNWAGVRKADKFGPRAMQRALFGDMNFRSNGVSED